MRNRLLFADTSRRIARMSNAAHHRSFTSKSGICNMAMCDGFGVPSYEEWSTIESARGVRPLVGDYYRYLVDRGYEHGVDNYQEKTKYWVIVDDWDSNVAHYHGLFLDLASAKRLCRVYARDCLSDSMTRDEMDGEGAFHFYYKYAGRFVPKEIEIIV